MERLLTATKGGRNKARDGQLSRPRRRPPPVANLRPMNRCAPCGANTAYEASDTLPGLTDLAAVLDYIAAHSPQAAKRPLDGGDSMDNAH